VVADATMTIGRVQVHRWPAPDHIGHGLSPDERAVVEDFEAVVDDLRAVAQATRDDLPVVMVGHSMGGLIATRHARRHREDLAGLELCSAAVGLAPVVEGPLAAPELPSDPIDPPVALARPVVERLARADSELHIVEGARHELSKAQTIESVASFAERVTAG
jgi:pimeloyl-ACP methyl ester carboxylesterase